MNESGLDLDLAYLDEGSSEQVKEAIPEYVIKALAEAEAKAGRTQKDEKKAKKYDLLLSKFLVQIILGKKHDDVLASLFDCLDKNYPSNFLLGILSLVFEPISYSIRDVSGKTKGYPKISHLDGHEFDSQNLPQEIGKIINMWYEDIMDVSFLEISSINAKKLYEKFKDEENIDLKFYFYKVFSHFFKENGINFSDDALKNYSIYIFWQVKKVYISKFEQLKSG